MKFNQTLQDQLLAMQSRDLDTREKLANSGELFKQGYHPEMKAIHQQNNQQIADIIHQYGWPGYDLVGEEGCHAAWLVVQHAVLEPELQQHCLALLEQAVQQDQAHPRMYAYLLDRVLVQKGEKQVFGTQHESDSEGNLIPCPLLIPQHIDLLRKSVGLLPLQGKTNELRLERKD